MVTTIGQKHKFNPELRVIDIIQSLSTAVVAGALADTNIAIAGIKTTHVLQSVVEIEATTADVTDRTSQCSITSDGNIQCTVATTGDKLIVTYFAFDNVN